MCMAMFYSFFKLSDRWWMVNAMPWPQYHQERPNTHSIEGWQGWSGQVWKILSLTGIRSPDHPAHGESLYWLHYPSPHHVSIYLAKSYFATSLSLTTYVAKLNGVFCCLNLQICPAEGTVLGNTGLYILEQSVVSGPWDENLAAA